MSILVPIDSLIVCLCNDEFETRLDTHLYTCINVFKVLTNKLLIVFMLRE